MIDLEKLELFKPNKTIFFGTYVYETSNKGGGIIYQSFFI